MKLLHIIATPRTDNSNTLRISEAFIEGLLQQHPDMQVTALDLFDQDVPAMAGDRIEAKYALLRREQLPQSMKMTWTEIEATIAGFMSADMYLLSVPMWNFTVPYPLKYYIDTIVQPGYTFKFQADGTPIGLASGKMVVVTTSGSDYSENSPVKSLDFVEPYLRGIFGFCGFTEIHFISANCMDYGPEIREANIRQAIEQKVPAVLSTLEQEKVAAAV